MSWRYPVPLLVYQCLPFSNSLSQYIKVVRVEREAHHCWRVYAPCFRPYLRPIFVPHCTSTAFCRRCTALYHCTTVPLYHIYHSSWLLCHTVIMNPVHCRPKTMVYWICDRSRLLLIKSVISLGDDKPSLLMPGRVGCDRSHAHQIDARAPTAAV